MDGILHLIETYGLWGVFAMMAIENMGVPFPTEPAYIVANRYIQTGQFTTLEVHAVLLAGHLTGACTSYYLGTLLRQAVGGTKQLNHTQITLQKWYARYGSPTVFVTRVIGYVRPWSSSVAGLARMPFFPFLLYTTLGTILLNIVCLAFAELFMHYWYAYPLARPVIVFSFAIGVLYLVLQKLRRGGHRKSGK
jgi:membrane protein DedA with SNARE-associated domain